MLNQFKNKILRKELLRFIIEGLLIIAVLGTMLGFLDILFRLSEVVVILTLFTSFFFYVFLTKRLRKTFTVYFKIYSILAVIFVMVGYYVMRVASEFAISILPESRPFDNSVYNPLVAFGLVDGWNSFAGILTNSINLLFYSVVGILSYQNMKVKM